jgi:hypothetical protein
MANVFCMRGFWKRRIPFLSILLVLGIVAYFLKRSGGPNTAPIPAVGGELFTGRYVLDTPMYLQTDPRWNVEVVGGSEGTLANVGCTLCCLAMGLDRFACQFTPKQLNEALKRHDGYTWRGLIRWEAIRRVTNGRVTILVVDKPSHAQIDTSLKNGSPLITKILLKNGLYHWVLIVGKEGTNYLVRDPLEENAGLTPLADYGSDILGIRIFSTAD